MPVPVVATETKSNCDGDTMCPVCKAKQERYMSFEGTETTPANNNSNGSDWKSMLPLIAITSLVTASLVIALKSSR
jgi:hypothetical protein